jgi:hypothetical protein
VLQGWQAEKQRAAELERQVSFFQASSATAIADRDSAVYEAQTCKAELEVRRLCSAAQHLSSSALHATTPECRCEQVQNANVAQVTLWRLH